MDRVGRGKVGKKSGVYFTKMTFAFLKDLAKNNNREWFRADPLGASIPNTRWWKS